jgi:hypothetical protein
MSPRVAAIKGKTPALGRMIEATITPMLEVCSEIITKIPAAIPTEIKYMLDASGSSKKYFVVRSTILTDREDHQYYPYQWTALTCTTTCDI